MSLYISSSCKLRAIRAKRMYFNEVWLIEKLVFHKIISSHSSILLSHLNI